VLLAPPPCANADALNDSAASTANKRLILSSSWERRPQQQAKEETLRAGEGVINHTGTVSRVEPLVRGLKTGTRKTGGTKVEGSGIKGSGTSVNADPRSLTLNPDF
jgi:hypothetical protein